LGVATVLVGCGKSTTVTVNAPPAGLGFYRVPSAGMEPTISEGAHVRETAASPTVGAIVVLHPPEGAIRQACGPAPHVVVRPGGAACAEPEPVESSVKFIKRIVAGPGDEIYITDGHVYRRPNARGGFVREPDSYIKPCGQAAECNFPVPIRIPAGHWFVLGDNRGESDDSRFWGPIPAAWIVGTVRLTTPAGSPE
jgi:signal peptidase I